MKWIFLVAILNSNYGINNYSIEHIEVESYESCLALANVTLNSDSELNEHGINTSMPLCLNSKTGVIIGGKGYYKSDSGKFLPLK